MSDETYGFLAGQKYSQGPWLDFVRDFQLNGVVYGSLNGLAVTEQASPIMGVTVATGEAWVQGDYYLNDAIKNISIAAADTTYTRHDLIVLRNYINGTRKISAIAITGIPAATPADPDITQNIDTWDIPIARVVVSVGNTQVQNAMINDLRWTTGRAQPNGIRVSDIQPDTYFNANSQRFVNMGIPVDINDGATIEYLTNNAIRIPAGYICRWPGLDIPTGWLECNGQAISYTDYPALYTQIGSLLPDLRGRTPMGFDGTQAEFYAIGQTGGEDRHQVQLSELPSHWHTGCYTYADGTSGSIGYSAYGGAVAGATASAGSGAPHENRPPFIVIKWIMRAY